MNASPHPPDPIPQTPSGSRPWSWRKLATAIVIATLGQFALISWLSAWKPVTPRAASLRPVVQFAPSISTELFALTDPTIFSRAHPQGFSGRAWLATAETDYQPADTDGAPATLTPDPETLGASFRGYVLTNDSARWTARYLEAPAHSRPAVIAQTKSAESRLIVKGSLEKLTPHFTPPLPVWTNADILSPSEVLLIVDARGNPVSATLVQPRSGYKPGEHDRRAVELAMQIAFRPGNPPGETPSTDPEAGLVSGRLIFLWHTVAPGTNGFLNPR